MPKLKLHQWSKLNFLNTIWILSPFLNSKFFSKYIINRSPSSTIAIISHHFAAVKHYFWLKTRLCPCRASMVQTNDAVLRLNKQKNSQSNNPCTLWGCTSLYTAFTKDTTPSKGWRRNAVFYSSGCLRRKQGEIILFWSVNII